MLILGLGLGMVDAGARARRAERGRLPAARRRHVRRDARPPDRRLDRRLDLRRDLHQPAEPRARPARPARRARADEREPGRRPAPASRDPRAVRRGRCGRASPGLPHRCRCDGRRVRTELAAARRAAARNRRGGASSSSSKPKRRRSTIGRARRRQAKIGGWAARVSSRLRCSSSPTRRSRDGFGVCDHAGDGVRRRRHAGERGRPRVARPGDPERVGPLGRRGDADGRALLGRVADRPRSAAPRVRRAAPPARRSGCR